MKTLVWRLCLDSRALIQTDKLKSNQIWKHVTEMFWPSLTINNAGQFSRFWRNSTTCHSDLWLSLGSLIPPWLGVKIIQERIGSHLLGKQLFVLPPSLLLWPYYFSSVEHLSKIETTGVGEEEKRVARKLVQNESNCIELILEL